MRFLFHFIRKKKAAIRLHFALLLHVLPFKNVYTTLCVHTLLFQHDMIFQLSFETVNKQ